MSSTCLQPITQTICKPTNPQSNSKQAFAEQRVDQKNVFDINPMMCEKYVALVHRQEMLDLGLLNLLIQTQEATKQHFSKLKQT